ncbi:MAG TPA: hypothetical protein VF534_27155 [Paraburkholderia sp.]
MHDLIAHPAMVLTGYSRLSLRFHDWTSFYARPRVKQTTTDIEVHSRTYGRLCVTALPRAGFFQIRHPRINHVLGVRAVDAIDAVEQAERWFDSLAEVGL